MYQQFYAIKFFFISLLLSIGIGITAQGQNISMYLEETWSPLKVGDGNHYGDVIVLKVQIANGESDITNSTLYAPIPAGTTYVPGSTIVNGAAVSDINGKMPFASGGLFNSPGFAAGVIPYDYNVAAPEMEYAVKITANAGTIISYMTLQGNTSSGNIVVKSNNFYSFLDPGSCNVIYQSTASTPIGTTYNYIKTVSATNGTAVATTFTPSGPSFNIVNGVPVSTTAGTVLTDAQAMALDPNANRLYFINRTTNNPAQELCYIDLNANPVAAYKYVGYPLETNTGTGYNIDRMTWGSDGYGYALTANGQDLIRFSIDPSTNLPVIQPLGPLVNDPNNGTNNVLAAAGGDMIADGSGKLYLAVNTNRMFYRINPSTRVATALGIIRGAATTGVTALATDGAGNIYIGGAFQNVYKLDLAATGGTSIIGSTANVYKTGDYASCGFPIFVPDLKAIKTYTNTTGAATVRAGDPIEFTIEVTNPGNTTATAVKLYDAIPPGCHYIPNSTTSDGVPVPDIGGAMPFSVSGGGFISTRLETALGIVKPEDINKVVIKFRVTTDENTNICNQATLTFTDANDNTISIVSDKSSQNSGRPTCFYSDKSALQATKTWNCPLTHATFVQAGDPVEYVIEVTNTGSSDATGVSLYDAIPANSTYMPGTTKMNGVAVSDIGGGMPFAVSGGQLINSVGASAGVITPGTANKVTVTFWVQTAPRTTVCNQATVIINNVHVISDDPTKSGTQDATCFESGPPPLGGRLAVNGTPNEQAAIIESVQVRPNPFVTNLNLQVQLNTEETVQVRLFDLYGRTVFTTFQKLGAGVNSLNLKVPSGLSKGIYVLEVKAGNNQVLQKKLLKQ